MDEPPLTLLVITTCDGNEIDAGTWYNYRTLDYIFDRGYVTSKINIGGIDKFYIIDSEKDIILDTTTTLTDLGYEAATMRVHLVRKDNGRMTKATR